jgi:hypothetical protein
MGVHKARQDDPPLHIQNVSMAGIRLPPDRTLGPGGENLPLLKKECAVPDETDIAHLSPPSRTARAAQGEQMPAVKHKERARKS